MWYGCNMRRVRRIRPWAVIATGVLAFVVCTGCSSAVSQDPPSHAQTVDYSPTGAYLRAREALIRSSVADLPAGRGPMAAFVVRVGTECSGALRGTPLDQIVLHPRHPSRAEVLAVLHNSNLRRKIEQGLEEAQQTPQAAAVARFATTVASIRWGNPRIADLVKTFGEIELQRRHMRQRNVCRDIREWVASDYRKVPSATSTELSGATGHRWMLDVAALGCGKFSPANPRVVLRALQPYQQSGAYPTTRDVEVMEIQLSFEEADDRENAARSLWHALGVSPSVTNPQRRRKHSRRSPHVLALGAPPAPPRCSGKPDRLSEVVKDPAGESSPE